MGNSEKRTVVKITALVHAGQADVWHCWTTPFHILKWNTAVSEWHTTFAENDLRTGGKFTSRMEAKDGSMGFDFWGIYNEIVPMQKIAYTLGDDRKVTTTFEEAAGGTWIVSNFEAESENPVEMQEMGWNNILQNFKKYVENGFKPPMVFEIAINAPVSKVFALMTEEAAYRSWTKVFNESSHYIGNWQKASEMLFVGYDAKGQKGGMVSTIVENIKDKFISIKHLGLVKGDEKIMEGPEVEPWQGGLENYLFFETPQGCLLRVEMDMNEEFKSYFEETWPKALATIKELAE